MTHATEDLTTNPEISAAQTLSLSSETDNGALSHEHYDNETPGPLSSEKNEEKLVTIIKKVY